jgi:hypothetical protein
MLNTESSKLFLQNKLQQTKIFVVPVEHTFYNLIKLYFDKNPFTVQIE